MKISILFILNVFILNVFILFKTHLYAADTHDCFTYKSLGKLVSIGSCQKRHPPQSTFKVAISLMGYNEGILTDEKHPIVPFLKGYPDSMEIWKRPHDPQMWMKNSCVWFSQYVTKKMGMKTFKSYVEKFHYGNADVSGTRIKPDGLSDAWISSSLKISPEEQINFLDSFINSKLPVSVQAATFTKNILFLEDISDGWKLYGKTGAGDLQDKKGVNVKTHERGWFVGWVEKGNERIIFAQYVEVKNIKTKENNFSYIASKQAKQLSLDKVKKLILGN